MTAALKEELRSIFQQPTDIQGVEIPGQSLRSQTDMTEHEMGERFAPTAQAQPASRPACPGSDDVDMTIHRVFQGGRAQSGRLSHKVLLHVQGIIARRGGAWPATSDLRTRGPPLTFGGHNDTLSPDFRKSRVMKNFLQGLLIFFSMCLCGMIAFQWVRETRLRLDVQDLTNKIRTSRRTS